MFSLCHLSNHRKCLNMNTFALKEQFVHFVVATSIVGHWYQELFKPIRLLNKVMVIIISYCVSPFTQHKIAHVRVKITRSRHISPLININEAEPGFASL